MKDCIYKYKGVTYTREELIDVLSKDTEAIVKLSDEAAKFRAVAIQLANGQSIIAALEAPIPTSLIHELVHSNFVDAMSEVEKQAFIDEYNEVFGDDTKEWNTDTEEFFARTYEVYISNGRQLSAAEVKNDKRRNILQSAFDTFTNLMKELYNGVITYNNTKGVTKPIVLSQQAQEFFDRINGIETIQQVEETITSTQQEIQDLVEELKTADDKRKLEIEKRIDDILAETTGGITETERSTIAEEEGVELDEVENVVRMGFLASVRGAGLNLIKGAKTALQRVINRMKTILLVGSIAAGGYYYNVASNSAPTFTPTQVAEQVVYFTPEEIQGNIAYVAEYSIGMQETGRNEGFTNQVFQGLMEAAGWQSGYPWCMTFAEVAAKHAGGMPESLMYDLQKTLTPSVIQSFNNLDESVVFKKSSTPEVGAIVFYERKDKKGFGHAGIVTRVYDDGTFDTIEGNTNSWGDADGDVVQAMQRSDREVSFNLLGFAVLNKENIDKAIEEDGGTPKEPTENGLFPFLPFFGRRKKKTEEVTEELSGAEDIDKRINDKITKLQEILKAKKEANSKVDNTINNKPNEKEKVRQPKNDERGQTKGGETKDVKQRFLERILATKSYPQEIKDAILSKAPTKVVIPDSVSTAVAEEYVRELTTLKEMQDGFEDLMKSWTDKVLAVTSFQNEVDLYSAVPQGAWEAMAVRMLHSKVTSVASPQQAAQFNQKVANLYSLLGGALRTAGLVDPRMTAIDALGQFAEVESKILDEETFKGSRKTHKETIENVKEIYDSVIQGSKADVKAEVKKRIANVSAKTGTATTKTSASAKTGESTLNKLSAKADFYLNRFNERVRNNFSSGFDIDALTDYALFVYYKTAGSIIKTKNAFEKKFGNESWETVVNSAAFADATYDIAKEKLLAMLSTKDSERSTSPDTTKNAASMVIESIVRHQRKRQGKEKKVVAPKTIEDIINARDLDIATLADLRRDIEAGLLNVDPEKRVEVLANVEDLLLSLAKDKLDTIASPWVKKSIIRQQLRGGGKNLTQVVDEMIDQVLDKDEITAPIAEEFISRTGMTSEEAAPYIQQIEDTIDDIINERVKTRVEKELVNSYGSLDSLATEIEKLEGVVNINKEMLTDAEKVWREASKNGEVADVRAAKQEYDKNKKTLIENTNRLKALKQKKESIKKELTRKTTPTQPRKKGIVKPSFTKVPTLENIANIVMKGGLSDETIREAFSQGLGTRNLTNADVDRIHTLITALENAVFAADRKPIAEELTRYVMGLKTKRDAQFFGDVFTSYVYGNMLGSFRTADLALSSALAQFSVTAIAEAGYQLKEDVKSFFKGNPDFANIRLMAESFKFAAQNNTLSYTGLMAVLKGKEGLSLVDVDPQNKGSRAYARLENNLTTLDQMRAMRDIYRKDGDYKKAALLSTLIGVNMLNRALMVADYVTTSVAIPYYLHRNMTNETMKELAEDGFIDPKFSRIQNIVNEKLGKDQLQQQLESEGLKKGTNKYDYRKQQLLFEFLDKGNREQLIRAEDEVRMLTWVGRIAGFSGKAYDFINSRLTPSKDSKITLEKVLGLAAIKLIVMPFPSAAIRAVQMVKNTTPLGIFQMKQSTIENISTPTKWDKIPFQIVNDMNFYGDKESYQMRPGQRAARVALALSSTALMGAVLNAAFSVSGGGEDDEYKIELDKDFPYLFTGKYNNSIKQRVELANLEYEPYTAYNIDSNGKITGKVGVYKDFPFLWSLAIVGKLQERLALDVVQRKEGAFTTEVGANDPLTTSEAYSLAITGLLGFTTQNSFSSSAGVITAMTKGLEGETFLEGAGKQMGEGLLRQVTPLSALQAEIDNYASIALDLKKKKGLGSISKVAGNMITTRGLVDNYDFDVLGRQVTKKPYGPFFTSWITNQIDALSDNYVEYENEAELLSKYLDVNEIKMLNFNRKGKDATSTTTVAKPADKQLLYDLTLEAQQKKANKIRDEYWDIKDLDKLKLTKKLESINTDINTEVIAKYVRDVLKRETRISMSKINSLKTMEAVNELFVAQNIYIDEEGKVKTIKHMEQALK
jgi:surface antigen